MKTGCMYVFLYISQVFDLFNLVDMKTGCMYVFFYISQVFVLCTQLESVNK